MAHLAVEKHGFTGRNAAVAESFVRAVRHLGGSEAEAEKVLGWYATTFGANSRVGIEDVGPAFEYAAKQRGWGDGIVNVATGWFATVHESGGNPEAVAPLSEPKVDATTRQSRLAQIRDLRRTAPDTYFADGQLQHEELQLLAAPAAANEEVTNG